MARRHQEGTIAWNTPVPAELSAAAHDRMAARGFNSKAEYVRSLIRADVEHAANQRLEQELLRAVERGDTRNTTPEFWDELRARARGSEPSGGSEERLEGVLDVLRRHADELRNEGVVHAAVFGSTARGEATPISDVDILVDLDAERSLGVFEFVGITQYLQALIPGADVVERKALKPLIRDRVLEDAIDAF